MPNLMTPALRENPVRIARRGFHVLEVVTYRKVFKSASGKFAERLSSFGVVLSAFKITGP